MRRKVKDFDASERHRIKHEREVGLMSWAEIAASHRISVRQVHGIIQGIRRNPTVLASRMAAENTASLEAIVTGQVIRKV